METEGLLLTEILLVRELWKDNQKGLFTTKLFSLSDFFKSSCTVSRSPWYCLWKQTSKSVNSVSFKHSFDYFVFDEIGIKRTWLETVMRGKKIKTLSLSVQNSQANHGANNQGGNCNVKGNYNHCVFMAQLWRDGHLKEIIQRWPFKRHLGEHVLVV